MDIVSDAIRDNSMVRLRHKITKLTCHEFFSMDTTSRFYLERVLWEEDHRRGEMEEMQYFLFICHSERSSATT